MQQYLVRKHLEVTRRFESLQLFLLWPMLNWWVYKRQSLHVSVSHASLRILWRQDLILGHHRVPKALYPTWHQERHSIVEWKISLSVSVRTDVTMDSWTYSRVAGLVIIQTLTGIAWGEGCLLYNECPDPLALTWTILWRATTDSDQLVVWLRPFLLHSTASLFSL